LDERQRLADQAKPDDLDWDLWVGPAPLRPYNGCYVPFKWRGWWDFGCGALGDMACHIMDMAYWALDLGAPLSVEAEAGGPTKETGPDWSTITYQFASRPSVGGGTLGGAVGPRAAVEQPAVKFVWYDGKKDSRQNAPYELLKQATRGAVTSEPAAPEPESKRAKKKVAATIDDPSRWDLILVGDAGTLLFRRSATDWIIAPGERAGQFQDVPQTIRRVANEDAEWIEACRGGPKALSSFDYAGPFTEMVLLGNLAVRLGKKVEWDAAALKATNAPEADELIRREYRPGWNLAVPPGGGT
jgi:predicted dehydrogenase